MARTRLLLIAPLLLLGCLRPPSPAEQVTDAARELNLATRFGRLDVASERASDAARKSFLERRRQWGNELRVVDIDLSGLSLPDPEHAEVMVNVAWMRMSEGLLRNTVVGLTMGLGGGLALVVVLNRLNLPTGLHPIFAIAAVLVVFAVTQTLDASGFLAVYVAGLVVGNRPVRAS